MVDSVYCSVCGNRISYDDTRICRTCGMIGCFGCFQKWLQGKPRKGNNGSSPAIQCKCNSTDVQQLEIVRAAIVKDYIDLRTKIKDIAYLPVDLYQEIRRIQSALLDLESGANFVLFSQDFTPRIDFDASLFNIETMLFEYLQDLAPALNYLYSAIIAPSYDYFLDPIKLQLAQFRAIITGDRITPFKEASRRLGAELASELERLKKFPASYDQMRKLVPRKQSISLQRLVEGEKFIYIGLASHLVGRFRKKKRIVVVSTHRIRILKFVREKFRKKLRTATEVEKDSITGISVKSQRLRQHSSLIMQTHSSRIVLQGKDIEAIRLSISRMDDAVHTLPVEQWKFWNL
ncbi:MAG TPA: hypothetical protein VJ044_17755, partial [Candidatus Hodarchaeales archaeon]|nr:hypothetical protein [Candidatus Hodarchaeales archaeon]